MSKLPETVILCLVVLYGLMGWIYFMSPEYGPLYALGIWLWGYLGMLLYSHLYNRRVQEEEGSG
ncbi:MAG: hypothetical protein OEW69_09280 [Nitrospirota bacterium]|nr:hypothetical protein [Nitrospirota bacterium]